MHVHIVTQANRALYARELEAMHRQRHRIFAEHMGWSALLSADGIDIDEFDTIHTVYFLTIDDDGVLHGSDRLNPTWRPHMLSHLFQDFVAGEIPTGPGLWEWSRHAPGDPDWPESANRQARLLSSIALLEFAASRGVDGFTGVLEKRVVTIARRLGWAPQELGPVVDYGEGEGVACLCPVNQTLTARLRRLAGRFDAVALEMPAHLEARRSVALAAQLSTEAGRRAEMALRGIIGIDRVYEEGHHGRI